jgi:hypothetical protein
VKRNDFEVTPDRLPFGVCMQHEDAGAIPNKHPRLAPIQVFGADNKIIGVIEPCPQSLMECRLG